MFSGIGGFRYGLEQANKNRKTSKGLPSFSRGKSGSLGGNKLQATPNGFSGLKKANLNSEAYREGKAYSQGKYGKGSGYDSVGEYVVHPKRRRVGEQPNRCTEGQSSYSEGKGNKIFSQGLPSDKKGVQDRRNITHITCESKGKHGSKHTINSGGFLQETEETENLQENSSSFEKRQDRTESGREQTNKSFRKHRNKGEKEIIQNPKGNQRVSEKGENHFNTENFKQDGFTEDSGGALLQNRHIQGNSFTRKLDETKENSKLEQSIRQASNEFLRETNGIRDDSEGSFHKGVKSNLEGKQRFTCIGHEKAKDTGGLQKENGEPKRSSRVQSDGEYIRNPRDRTMLKLNGRKGPNDSSKKRSKNSGGEQTNKSFLQTQVREGSSRIQLNEQHLRSRRDQSNVEINRNKGKKNNCSGRESEGKTKIGRENSCFSSKSEESRQSEKWGNYFSCVWSNEIDKYASQIYRKNFGTEELVEADIRTINSDTIPNFDLLTAGFPCQAFSVAGQRKGFEDFRGTLFYEIYRIAEAKRPKILLLENVKGLLSAKAGICTGIYKATKGEGKGELTDNLRRIKDEPKRGWEEVKTFVGKGYCFTEILHALETLGYWIEWQIFNSKNHGVPQNRERVFIIGHLTGTSTREIFPIGEVNEIPPRKNEPDTRRPQTEISSTIRGPNVKADHTFIVHNVYGGFKEDKARIFKDYSPTIRTPKGGGHLPMVVESKKIIDTCSDVDGKIRTYTKFAPTLRARDYKEPLKVVQPMTVANTVTPDAYLARGARKRVDGKAVLTSMHERRIRRLTPIECERLQGFPDGWTEFGVQLDSKEHNLFVERAKKDYEKWIIEQEADRKEFPFESYFRRWNRILHPSQKGIVKISDTQRYKCLGNAVTTNVIEFLGYKIMESLQENAILIKRLRE